MPRTRTDVHSLGRFVIIPVPGMPGLLAYGTDLASAQANAQEVTALLLRGTAADPGQTTVKPARQSKAATAPQPGAKPRGRPRKHPLPETVTPQPGAKPRGRPRKHPLPETVTPQPGAKRRGRPRKHPLPETVAAPQPGAKRRGRPRKNPLPEVPVNDAAPEIIDMIAAAPPVVVLADPVDEVILEESADPVDEVFVEVQSAEPEMLTTDVAPDQVEPPISG